ncbi:MAG: hypothetical protein MI784_04120 [Cytophagales bacterium]|nr:hypothetical protein [Cytophagales bacterium]
MQKYPKSQPIIQAMFFPARVLANYYGCKQTEGKIRPIKSIVLQTGQTVVVSDQTTFKEGTGDESLTWYECIAEEHKDKFFLREDFFERLKNTGSFESMMDIWEYFWKKKSYFDLAFKQSLHSERSFGNILYANISHLNTPKHHEIRETGLTEETILKRLFALSKQRPPNATFKVGSKLTGSKIYSLEQLEALESTDELKKGYLFFQGNEQPHQRLKQEQEMTKLLSMPSKKPAPKLPYARRFFLNSPIEALPDLLTKFLPYLDATDSTTAPLLSAIFIPPFVNRHPRVYSINFEVFSEEGFRRIQDLLLEHAQEHPAHFQDATLPMSQKIAPGISWGEEVFFDDPWEIGETYTNRIRNFLKDLNKKMLEEESKSISWNKLFKGKKQDELKRRTQKACQELGTDSKYTLNIDKFNLLAIAKLSEELFNLSFPSSLLKWLEQLHQLKLRNTESSTFLSHRLEALEEASIWSPKNFDDLLRGIMREFREKRIDFFSPHLNLPVPESFSKSDDFVDIRVEEGEAKFNIVPAKQLYVLRTQAEEEKEERDRLEFENPVSSEPAAMPMPKLEPFLKIKKEEEEIL